jgi:tetratricopeptide (TPR) repeat protein
MRDLLGLGLGRRKEFRRAVGAATWLHRGVELESSDPAAAAAAYRRALAGCPGYADAHNNLGRLLHVAGDLLTAEFHYRQAIAASATDLHWFNLGVVLEDSTRPDDAIIAYREALTHNGALKEAHLNLARLLDRRGRGHDNFGDLQAAVRHLGIYRRLRLSSRTGE